MTDILIETAEEEFLKGNFRSAYHWAVTAKLLDPFYGSVDQYAEAYRVHWANSEKKTPSGETDLYAVLAIKDRLWISPRMITHTYVQLAKRIDPEVHCSAAAPGALKLVTSAWEILSEPKSRQDYHTRSGLPPPKCEEVPQIPIKLMTLEEVNSLFHRQWEERQRKEPPEITVESVGCAPKRQGLKRPDVIVENFEGVLKRQLEERPEIAVKKFSCEDDRCREERPEINDKKVSFAPNPHRRDRREVSVQKFSCTSRPQRDKRREISFEMVSCTQKRGREERPEHVLKEFNSTPKRHRIGWSS
ncbi:DnaJ domain containing protein [Melia azedarach]|uniref:DnaJ domain containing protein n=1 Tax=Melia azedarach TaxID=155640 RepID=A0ACC1YJA0_MELAZ|nr:DnaJ domain containing protein [Melia azedarach]